MRWKIKNGENKSWALLTMEEPSAVEAILAADDVFVNGRKLSIKRFSTGMAAASTGAMQSEYKKHAADLDCAAAVVLWRRLSMLLKLSAYAGETWGTPAETRQLLETEHFAPVPEESGTTAEEGSVILQPKLDGSDLERQARVRRCFFLPESHFRTYWDMAQVVLLMYVVVMVPLKIGFELETELFATEFWIEVGVDLYFLVDIFGES